MSCIKRTTIHLIFKQSDSSIHNSFIFAIPAHANPARSISATSRTERKRGNGGREGGQLANCPRSAAVSALAPPLLLLLCGRRGHSDPPRKKHFCAELREGERGRGGSARWIKPAGSLFVRYCLQEFQLRRRRRRRRQCRAGSAGSQAEVCETGKEDTWCVHLHLSLSLSLSLSVRLCKVKLRINFTRDSLWL